MLGEMVSRAGAATALDLFTGTTRVAQEWKRRTIRVTAVDSARYAAVLGECYIATDASEVDSEGVREVLLHLDNLPGTDGYFTDTFSRQARFFQEANARRIDAIRDAIDSGWTGHPWRPILLTALLQAADRVDSTTGLQMAYLKAWAPRSYQPLELRMPDLLAGPGTAWQGDAVELATRVPPVDVAYLDPPYNQHRYAGNYHVWETLMAWDAPEHYGVACKRVDLKDTSTASVFNSRRAAPAAMTALVETVRAELMIISGSDEGWVGVQDLAEMASTRGTVEVLAFDSKRYVGAQIGIHNQKGEKVGRVGRRRNTEFLVVAGPAPMVSRVCAGYPAVAPSWLQDQAGAPQNYSL